MNTIAVASIEDTSVMNPSYQCCLRHDMTLRATEHLLTGEQAGLAMGPY